MQISWQVGSGEKGRQSAEKHQPCPLLCPCRQHSWIPVLAGITNGSLEPHTPCDTFPSPFPIANLTSVCSLTGKAYEITYVRLKFHTSRPESFAIYKRSREGGPWEPYQYYSASCQRTYGKAESHLLHPGEEERVAFCTSEFSDISPLSGGNVAFSTLEGRPSAYNFEDSLALQVTK